MVEKWDGDKNYGEECYKVKIYKKYNKNGKLVQTAKISRLYDGRYCFETSVFGQKPYEININMPYMNTKSEAEIWIENNAEWE